MSITTEFPQILTSRDLGLADRRPFGSSTRMKKAHGRDDRGPEYDYSMNGEAANRGSQRIAHSSTSRHAGGL
ncbi:hypothetical protein, partial [Halorubrum rubrum]|uniref:hypothetical protein n=1 Tax=Halorubrum rubrum TaxID=1126240 RepID=UPI002111B7AA